MSNSVWVSNFGLAFDGTTATFTPPVSMLSTLFVTGLITTSGGILTNTNGDITISAARFLSWNTRASMNSPADSQANITNFAGTVGAGFDISTDAVLKVRTRAQTGYATVDCLGLKASGAAGANFGPSAVASLTIVNGIVTAAS